MGGARRQVVAVLLDLGAHHLDLMFPSPDDPPCAKMARDLEETHIRKWITEAYANHPLKWSRSSGAPLL